MRLDGQSGRRVLGAYLICCAIYQGGVYLSSRGLNSMFDPRLGTMFFAGTEQRLVAIQWISVVWLGAIGVAIATKWRVIAIVLYILSELVLSCPTMMWVALSLTTGTGELTLSPANAIRLLLIISAFSAVPLAFAIYLLVGFRRPKKFDGSTAGFTGQR